MEILSMLSDGPSKLEALGRMLCVALRKRIELLNIISNRNDTGMGNVDIGNNWQKF